MLLPFSLATITEYALSTNEIVTSSFNMNTLAKQMRPQVYSPQQLINPVILFLFHYLISVSFKEEFLNFFYRELSMKATHNMMVLNLQTTSSL